MVGRGPLSEKGTPFLKPFSLYEVLTRTIRDGHPVAYESRKLNDIGEFGASLVVPFGASVIPFLGRVFPSYKQLA